MIAEIIFIYLAGIILSYFFLFQSSWSENHGVPYALFWIYYVPYILIMDLILNKNPWYYENGERRI